MEQWLQTLLTVVASVLCSSGFWAYLQHKRDTKDATSRLILGLAHDRIIDLCMKYIDRGYITHDEYENLYKYLFKPYTEKGGNGSAARLMAIVNSLPVRDNRSSVGGGANGNNPAESQ